MLPAMSQVQAASPEAGTTFDCFGAECSVQLIGDGPLGDAGEAVGEARRRLLAAHERFTLLSPDSELSRLNRDPRERVPASRLMVRFAVAARTVAAATDGLVDPTRPRGAWAALAGDPAGGFVIRPPGTGLDADGIVKGLLADLLAEALAAYPAYALDCAGTLRVGGTAPASRVVQVPDPSTGEPLHASVLLRGAASTAHGAFQATAWAPTALEAEWRAKAALLSGPEGAAARLRHGGV